MDKRFHLLRSVGDRITALFSVKGARELFQACTRGGGLERAKFIPTARETSAALA